jgi:hypothetical protein
LKEKSNAEINKHLMLVISGKLIDIIGYTGMMMVTPFVLLPSVFATFLAKYVMVSMSPSKTEKVVRLEYDIYTKQRDMAKLCKRISVIELRNIHHNRRGVSSLFNSDFASDFSIDNNDNSNSNDDNNNNTSSENSS